MYTFLRWLKAQTWGATALYGISVAFMLYTHYFGAVLFLSEGLFFVMYTLVQRHLNLKSIGQGLTAYVIALILFAPWLPTFLWRVHFSSRRSSP